MNSKLLKSKRIYRVITGEERLIHEFIKRMEKLLDSHTYLTYKFSYANDDYQHELNVEGQLEFYFGKPLDNKILKNIRRASQVWNDMMLINRLTVLDAFSTLYSEVLADYSPTERTILFCQIFINDFVEIIATIS